jgi:hypothetical protein
LFGDYDSKQGNNNKDQEKNNDKILDELIVLAERKFDVIIEGLTQQYQKIKVLIKLVNK